MALPNTAQNLQLQSKEVKPNPLFQWLGPLVPVNQPLNAWRDHPEWTHTFEDGQRNKWVAASPLGYKAVAYAYNKAAWILQVLPIKNTGGALEVVLDKLEFGRGTMRQVPQKGNVHYLSHSESREMVGLIRHGIGLHLNGPFWKTERGRQLYSLQLLQVSNAISDTIFFNVINAFLTAGKYSVDWERKHGYYTQKHILTVFEKELELWAILQKNEIGLELLDAKMTQMMANQGAKSPGDLIIMPKKVQSYAMFKPYLWDYSKSGVGALALRRANEVEHQIFNGEDTLDIPGENITPFATIKNTRVYLMDDILMDPTQSLSSYLDMNNQQIGEYWVMFDPQTLKGGYNGILSAYSHSVGGVSTAMTSIPYRTANLSFTVYDEEQDQMVPIMPEVAVENCHMFNEYTGKLQRPQKKHRTKFPDDDDDDGFLTHRTADGVKKMVEVFGHIKPKHFSERHILDLSSTVIIGVLNNSGLTIREVNENIQKAKELFDFLSKRKFTREWIALIMREHVKTYLDGNKLETPINDDNDFARLLESGPAKRDAAGYEWKRNISTGTFVLPDLKAKDFPTDADDDKQQIVDALTEKVRNQDGELCGFANWAGFKALAEEYSNSMSYAYGDASSASMSKKGYPMIRCKQAYDFVRLVETLVEHLDGAFHDSAFLNPKNSDTSIRNPTAHNVIMETLLQMHGIPLWISKSSVNSGVVSLTNQIVGDNENENENDLLALKQNYPELLTQFDKIVNAPDALVSSKSKKFLAQIGLDILGKMLVSLNTHTDEKIVRAVNVMYLFMSLAYLLESTTWDKFKDDNSALVALDALIDKVTSIFERLEATDGPNKKLLSIDDLISNRVILKELADFIVNAPVSQFGSKTKKNKIISYLDEMHKKYVIERWNLFKTLSEDERKARGKYLVIFPSMDFKNSSVDNLSTMVTNHAAKVKAHLGSKGPLYEGSQRRKAPPKIVAADAASKTFEFIRSPLTLSAIQIEQLETLFSESDAFTMIGDNDTVPSSNQVKRVNATVSRPLKSDVPLGRTELSILVGSIKKAKESVYSTMDMEDEHHSLPSYIFDRQTQSKLKFNASKSHRRPSTMGRERASKRSRISDEGEGDYRGTHPSTDGDFYTSFMNVNGLSGMQYYRDDDDAHRMGVEDYEEDIRMETLFTETFMRIWENLEKLENSIFKLMIAKIYMGTPITKNVVRAFLAQDIILPFNFIVARPHQAYTTSIVIKTVSGEQTGATYTTETETEVSKSFHEDYDVRINTYMGSHVHAPENVICLPNTFISVGEHGCGTAPIQLEDYDPAAGIYGRHREDSLFFFIIPYEVRPSDLPSPLDITGYLKQFREDGQGPIDGPNTLQHHLLYGDGRGPHHQSTLAHGKKYDLFSKHYPTAAWYSGLWGFDEMLVGNEYQPTYTTDAHGNPNTLTYPGGCVRFDPMSGRYTGEREDNKGHWGKLTGTGMRKRRFGTPGVSEKSKSFTEF